jgi:hypothetical protein
MIHPQPFRAARVDQQISLCEFIEAADGSFHERLAVGPPVAGLTSDF